MTRYWCRFISAGGHSIGGEFVVAARDDDAAARARAIFADVAAHYQEGDGGTFEVWDGKRLVQREELADHGPPVLA
jgi:hypothetical protein